MCQLLDRTRWRRISGLIAVGLGCVALSACGSSQPDATALLKQTFGGTHKVDSGKLDIVLTVNPSGSNTLKAPITLSFAGPFQSLGKGKLPQSDFNISLDSGGSGGSVAILSTGTAGYVTFQGQAYQLPQAAYQKLESSFSSVASTPGSSGGGALSKLGIAPLHWLQNPTVIGTENVGGTDTTHIRAGINVTALLADFNTFLSRASSLGVSGAGNFPHGISAASQSRIATAIKNPHFDVWTGNGDRTIRKLQVGLTLPVTGQISTLLGGLSSADIGLSMEYSGPQPAAVDHRADVGRAVQRVPGEAPPVRGGHRGRADEPGREHGRLVGNDRSVRRHDHARGRILHVQGLLAVHPGRGERHLEDAAVRAAAERRRLGPTLRATPDQPPDRPPRARRRGPRRCRR